MSGERPIASIMSRALLTVSLDDTLGHIAFVLERNGIHHIIVTNEDKKVAGVISDRDVLRATSPFVGKLAERTQDLATLKVHAHQLMTRELWTTTEATTVREAADLMLKHGISCLPVVNLEGHAVGIVTWRDLLRALNV